MRSMLFDQKYSPSPSSERWVMHNSRMLRANLGPDVLAAKGAMVAYQGQLTFNHEGSGNLGRLVRRMVSSDDAPLMRVQGQGWCYFARLAEEIFTLELEGDGISVGGAHILAFDASLEWDIRRTQGGMGAMMSQGVFNTLIQGRGTVALTSDGPPLLMDCSQSPVFVDPQAVLCWSANLQPTTQNSMNMRSMLRGGSGENFQLVFHGPGFVVVQPSEGAPVPSSGGSGGGLGGLLG